MEKSALGRGLLSIFIVVTLIAIVTINLPGSDLRRQLLRGGTPYLYATGLDQNWALFAPNPRSVVIDVFALVTFDDGTTARWHVPRDGALIGAYRDYHWRKWAEYLINPASGVTLWRPAALWAASEERRPHHGVAEVTLIERFAQLDPPGVRPSIGPTQQTTLYSLALTDGVRPRQ